VLYTANLLVGDCRLTQNEHYFSYIVMRTKLYIRRDDNDIRFALAQHPWLDFFNETTIRGRHVASLGHIILIPSQPLVALSP